MPSLAGFSGARRLRAWLPAGAPLPESVWRQRHRGILALLWLHLPAIFAFAVLQGVGIAHAAVESSIIAMFAGMATMSSAHRRLSTVVTAVGLLTCSAELVHLSGGVIEMHFHYFVMVGVITLYQDWWPFLVAIGYVVLQHGVAGVISPESVYNHTAAVEHPWRWAAIHGFFVLGMSASGIVTWRLNEALLAHASERERRLSEAQEVAHLGSWELDLATRRFEWSDEMHRLYDIDFGEVTVEAVASRLHPEDRERVLASVRDTTVRGIAHSVDYRVVHRNGTIRWLHGSGELIRNANGEAFAMAGTAQDITEQRRSLDALRASEAESRHTLSLLTATLDSTADGILVVDDAGRITSFNQQFVDMWRIPDTVLADRDDNAAIAFVLDQLQDPEGFAAKVQELYDHPEAESFDVLDFKDGRVFERSSRPQRVDGGVVGRVWSFHDATERIRLEHELAHQAFHDSLTGLANQALFRDRIDHAVARIGRTGGQLAVLFVDLDNFKHINDSLGHTAGDELLVTVTKRLQNCLRPADTAARLGGDEFAVLLEDIYDESEPQHVADRIINSLAYPFTLGSNEVFVTASIGIACDGAGTAGDQLLRNADLAMYTAKNNGKAHAEVFRAAMHTAALERLEVEGDLRRAIERSEFVVHYQPIIDLATGRLCGVEALVRWAHPTRGIVGPLAFIPLAEETGLIQDIGAWVLNRACRDVQQLERGDHEELTLSVNLSTRQLLAPGLATVVADAAATSGLEPSRLILEITETSMMRDTETAIRILNELKRVGVRLAVDDFGTGYSSLSYLQRFPIDILKIDKSFVDTIDQSPEDSALGRAIVRLGQTLRLTTIAEGVETESQAELLRSLGCGQAQGFHFAHPMPLDELGRWRVDATPSATRHLRLAQPPRSA